MGDKNDNFAYQMEILVAADSKIETPAQIKGKRVTLTSMSSLSGFKAPLMYLWKNENLAPDTDFKITISANQKASIIELKDGQAEIIAVANDYLARVLNSEKIDPKAFRTIYKSPSYPPACFGHANDLKPELAKKIKEAFLTFKWEGTGLEKAYLPANQVKFVEVSYKKDWESVRAIDKDVLEKIGLE
jgi:phosphonate transport system substrate-binding protein